MLNKILFQIDFFCCATKEKNVFTCKILIPAKEDSFPTESNAINSEADVNDLFLVDFWFVKNRPSETWSIVKCSHRPIPLLFALEEIWSTDFGVGRKKRFLKAKVNISHSKD